VTKTYIKKNKEILFVGDGGIDIFGNYKKMNYILQAKYRTNEDSYVSPKDVREFAAILMDQPENTVGFFVSNAKYSTRTQNYAINSKVNLVLCNENDLVTKIKEAQSSSLFNTNDICIEDVTTEDDVEIDMFGIKFNGKIRIGRILSKRIRDSVKPY
jgi:hypothetical protein